MTFDYLLRERLDGFTENPVYPNAAMPRVRVGADSADDGGRADYPLMGMTGRPSVAHFASLTHWTPMGEQLNGIRLVQTHPATGGTRHRRRRRCPGGEPPGSVLGTALLWEGIRQDTVFVPNTFGPDQEVGDRFGAPRYEPANLLLDDDHFDNVSGQQAYKCFACSVAKA